MCVCVCARGHVRARANAHKRLAKFDDTESLVGLAAVVDIDQHTSPHPSSLTLISRFTLNKISKDVGFNLVVTRVKRIEHKSR